jgi:hypothetical protein
MVLSGWALIPIPIGAESWVTFSAVLIVLIVFIGVVARLVTRVTEDSDPAETDRQMLTAINDLHRKGDLSQEEFRSIKGQLVDRLQKDRTSYPAGSSDKEDHADSAGPTAVVSGATATEAQDTIVDSVTHSGLSPNTQSFDSEDESEESDEKG